MSSHAFSQKVPSVLKIQAYSEKIESEERERVIKFISEVEENNRKREIAWQKNRKKNGSKFDSLILKSNIKKTTILLKKLKQFSSAQLDSILKDIHTLNVSKFLSEIIHALMQSQLKISDINAACKVSSELHLLYVDFANEFLESWGKCLTFDENTPMGDRQKYKVDLIFFCELVALGVLHTKNSLDFLYNTLTAIIKEDLRYHQNVDILYIFCKHCARDFLGVVPRNMRILSTKHNISIPCIRVISTDFQDKVKSCLKEYYASMITSLTRKNEALSSSEMRCNEYLLEKGDIHPDKIKCLQIFKKELDLLKRYTDKLSNILDLNKPSLKRSIHVPRCDIHGLSPYQLIHEIWGDEDTNEFYNELPSVEEYMLLNSRDSDTNFDINSVSTEEVSNSTDTNNDEVNVEDLNFDIEWNEEEDSVDQLDIFFNSLSNCLNKSMIDNGAIEFLITNNNKEAHNKLVQYIYHLPRSRADLFPFICRFLAIVSQAYPEISKRVSDMYYKQFRYFIMKKDQVQLQSKLKNVRIIAELIKFKLFSNIYGLFCLKLLMQDLSNHHIEMACVFLEICGRFLYFSQETHIRAKSYLEQMVARKNNIILDVKYKIMIESVYNMIPPKDSTRKASKRKPLMLEFIRHLIYTKLDTDNVERVTELLEKLNWNDPMNPKIEEWVIQCLANPSEIQFNKISCMAMLVQALTMEHEAEMIQVIDSLLEGIRIGLERMDKPMYQKRISMAAYLGELFMNCDLVNIDLIVTTLYTIIAHLFYQQTAGDLCKIAQVLTILDTCSNQFPKEVLENELNDLVILFQSYFVQESRSCTSADSRFKLILLKQKYEETMHRLYPDNKLLQSLDEPLCSNDSLLEISHKYNLMFNNLRYFQDEELDKEYNESVHSDNDKKRVEKAADDSLIEAYDRLIAKSIKERADSVLPPNLRDTSITIPIKKSLGVEGAETQFFILTRKANRRPMLKEISIPSDSDIVSTLKSSQKSYEVEMKRVKQITLQHNNRLLEEDCG